MKILSKRIINAPADALWEYLADYSNIHRFHPLLSGSHFVEGSESCELGSTRQCDFSDGNFLKERVIDWEDGSHYTVEIYETSMPIKNAKATLGVRALGENASEAYMELEMEPKIKLMQPMLFLMFKYKAAPSILKGLADLYEVEHTFSIA